MAAGLILLAGVTLQVLAVAFRSPVLPDLAALGRAALCLTPSLVALTLPLALLAGLTVGLGRWVDEGAWTALRAAGVGGTRLVPGVIFLALAVALATALCTHAAGPWGRREAARLLAEVATRVELVPGRFLPLGDAVLFRAHDGSLFGWQPAVAVAGQEGRLTGSGEDLRLELGPGRAVGPGDGAFSLTFESASVPLRRPVASRRVELEERTGAELARLASDMRATGQDPARVDSIRLKRTLLPLAVPLLALLAVPLALRTAGRALPALGVVLGYWVLLRLGDALVPSLGALLASALPCLGLLGANGLAWAWWRDR